MLGEHLELPARVWANLNAGWSLGFLFAGALNLYVVYNYSEAVWVNFKLLGSLALSLLFALITIAYLGLLGHLKEPQEVSATAQDDASGDA